MRAGVKASLVAARVAACAAVAVVAVGIRSEAAPDLAFDDVGDVIAGIARVVRGFRLGESSADLGVTADYMEFDYDAGHLAYNGNVRVIHGDVHLSADRLSVRFEPGGNKPLESIRAEGNVEVRYGSETATGQLALYRPQDAKLTLSGNARLGSGQSSIDGERVIVDLQARKATVEGNPDKRVRAVIDPKTLDVEELLD